jgi:hypothetical protein
MTTRLWDEDIQKPFRVGHRCEPGCLPYRWTDFRELAHATLPKRSSPCVAEVVCGSVGASDISVIGKRAQAIDPLGFREAIDGERWLLPFQGRRSANRANARARDFNRSCRLSRGLPRGASRLCWSLVLARPWRSAKHATQWMTSLESHAMPILGDVPVAKIDRALVIRVLEPIWKTHKPLVGQLGPAPKERKSGPDSRACGASRRCVMKTTWIFCGASAATPFRCAAVARRTASARMV